ncbi:MAG: SusC/RagA family TonB-linked outer membrane protein [Dysgonamonadaceae bacterium]|jgi:TonB-linked SusC/RagA family outer membrane protein|nr:SusC/RagA family TonB-linked outer membrane protein [Dysgonamonadaceae bacterium]
MKRLALLFTCFLTSVSLAIAQNKQVSGTVVDETGEPVIGASVVVKGNASVGTATDLDGKFTLNVPASTQTLVIKFLGKQDQEVEAVSNVTVTLLPLESILDEVIVVAYGTAKKSSFTGSASIVKSDKLAARSVSNITNALSGQTAGVQVSNTGGGQPGTAATIRIRGFGSFSASSSPLYVVDGTPFEGNISSINSADIESITILKDAAANAIYGARGANGVVLVTTKKGNTRDAKITVDAKWGSNSRAVPNYAVMTDPGMYYETLYKSLYNSRAYNGFSASDAYAYADATLYAGSGGAKYLVYTVPEGEKLIGMNFKLNPNATLGYYDGEYYYTPDDWYKETFSGGNLRQEYNVSVSGSTDKLNYYLSVGYLDDKGIIPSSGFTRFSGLAKADYQAKKWLKVGSSIAVTQYDMKAPPLQTDWGSSGNLFYNTNMIAPVYPMYMRSLDEKGNPYILRDEQGQTMYDYGNTTNFTRSFLPMSNPLGSLALDKYSTLTDALISKWYAVLTPVEGLTITANLGANLLNRRYSYLYNPFHGGAAGAGGIAEVEHDRDVEINQQYLANYTKTFDNVHNFDILAGFESFGWTMQTLGGTRQNLYNPWVGELSNGIQWPPSDMYSSTDKYATQGFLSRIQYNYDEKYFASASYRRDASSRFHPDNRWGNFGSAGLAWLISKEDFFSSLKEKVNMLKLKISYGVQGNDKLSLTNYYNYADQFEIQNDGNDAFSLVPIIKGNKDISWETSYSWNGGADFELFNSRLNGSLEYFYRTTKDMLYNKPLPASSGFRTMPINALDMINHGAEIDLTGIVFKNQNVEWDVFANLTWFHNEITNIPASASITGDIKTSTYILKKGGSIYNAYMLEHAGIDKTTGKELFYVDPDNGDFTTTDDKNKAKQTDLGATYAPWYGGFGTTVKAYGFDFSLQFAYQLGGRLYDDIYQELMHSGQSSMSGYNWHKDILQSWTPENPDASIPRLASSDDTRQLTSSRFLTSSNYLNLNSATLGYTFSERWLKKANIATLRLFVSGDNLALFSARQGFDPRANIALGSTTSDYSSGSVYSLLRTVSGGISITF